MTEMILKILICWVWTLLGGWFIKQSIINFKREWYMLFGMNIMFAIYTVGQLIKYGVLL